MIVVGTKYLSDPDHKTRIPISSRKEFLAGSIVLLVWVLLSGIGGYAFQNADFHGRNAIFRDLVAMKWPVIYTYRGQDAYSSYGFNYYIGFWLPSALIGKLLGWKAANFALIVWTWMGVLICAYLLTKKTKIRFIHAVLLLIFFSGMDIAGLLITRRIIPSDYPGLWPPIQHLEWWAPDAQFSSFTTQLFWVFNQAIPAWVATLIILNQKSKKSILLIFALCAFLSPISAIGLSLITVHTVLFSHIQQENFVYCGKKGRWVRIGETILREIKKVFTIENCIGGGLILVTSLLFYYSSSNDVPRQVSGIRTDNLYVYIIFSLCEWAILWLLLFSQYKKTPLFYMLALFLLLAPAVKFSESQVIAKRGTIPLLMILMVWCATYMREGLDRKRVLMIVMLIFGALTPIYEINRSIYRTWDYYIGNQREYLPTRSLYAPYANKPVFPSRPEEDHPGVLAADEWVTLSVFNPESMGNWIGPIEDSFFYQYLSK